MQSGNRLFRPDEAILSPDWISNERIITKASLLAGVGFALAMYCRETGCSSHDFSCRPGFGAPLVGNDFSSRTCTPPPRVQTPLRPSGTENGNSLEKGVNIHAYRRTDIEMLK